MILPELLVKHSQLLKVGKGAWRWRKCLGVCYLFLFALKQFEDMKAILDFNKRIQSYI